MFLLLFAVNLNNEFKRIRSASEHGVIGDFAEVLVTYVSQLFQQDLSCICIYLYFYLPDIYVAPFKISIYSKTYSFVAGCVKASIEVDALSVTICFQDYVEIKILNFITFHLFV